MDPFHFFPNNDHRKPTYRVEYQYSHCGVETSSPAIFCSEQEAIQTALDNKTDATGIKVEKYNKQFKLITIFEQNWR